LDNRWQKTEKKQPNKTLVRHQPTTQTTGTTTQTTTSNQPPAQPPKTSNTSRQTPDQPPDPDPLTSVHHPPPRAYLHDAWLEAATQAVASAFSMSR
jgi:hypothetical protein